MKIGSLFGVPVYANSIMYELGEDELFYGEEVFRRYDFDMSNGIRIVYDTSLEREQDD